ncbi:hypothetical protein ACLOJK_041778 [Asimina triloba]
MLSNKATLNPDFYDWNKIKVRYCDGASFTGDVERVDPATKLHFRGARVFLAIIEDLMAKGMRYAKNALLSGCSAGGLTSTLHCDRFRSLMPMSTKVKCLADAGYFINAKDVSGAEHIRNFYDEVVATHSSFSSDLEKNINTVKCNAVLLSPPGYSIASNLFISMKNSCFYLPSIKNILAPGMADPHGHWHNCKEDINKCSASQLQTMQGYRLEFIRALVGVGTSSRGMFINSCYAHCQSEMQETWLRSDSPVLGKTVSYAVRAHCTTISKAVGDWYLDRNPFKKIDCPYPCDSSCHNRIFDNDNLSE